MWIGAPWCQLHAQEAGLSLFDAWLHRVTACIQNPWKLNNAVLSRASPFLLPGDTSNLQQSGDVCFLLYPEMSKLSAL